MRGVCRRHIVAGDGGSGLSALWRRRRSCVDGCDNMLRWYAVMEVAAAYMGGGRRPAVAVFHDRGGGGVHGRQLTASSNGMT